MKIRFIVGAWIALNALQGFAWGQIDPDPQDFGSQEITQPAKRSPFSFETHSDFIGQAEISKGEEKHDKVQFAEAEVQLGMVVYYCPAYEEGLRIALGYTSTYLCWNENPWFEQDHFHTGTLNIGGFTHRLDQWFWRAALAIHVDTQEWSSDYTFYDILVWGRYEFSKNIGLHVGFWAETGMNLNRIWPIIGADWQVSKKWKLNLVYPVNVALEYALTNRWALALAGRNFDSRFRAHDQKRHNAKTLIRYQNIGAEFMVKYEAEGISANIHAGTTLGGTYRLANAQNHHPHTYQLKPSGYFGGEIDVKF